MRDETMRRDLSGFYGPEHDFGIVLFKKGYGNIVNKKSQVITVT